MANNFFLENHGIKYWHSRRHFLDEPECEYKIRFNIFKFHTRSFLADVFFFIKCLVWLQNILKVAKIESETQFFKFKMVTFKALNF